MIKFSTANYGDTGWRINGVVLNWVKSNPKTQRLWIDKGYEGIFASVSEHFGMKMHRNDRTQVEFVFTEEQFTMFALKWL